MMQMMDTKLKQVDVLPMVKHYITELGLHDILDKYVPNDSSSRLELKCPKIAG